MSATIPGLTGGMPKIEAYDRNSVGYVVSRYDLKDFLSIVRQSIGLLALASLAIAIVAPDIGRDDPLGPDGWRGVFSSKNNLGVIIAIGAVTYIYSLFTLPPKFMSMLFYLAGLVLCLGMLYLSHSATALILVIVGVPLCVVIRLSHKRLGVAVIVWTSLLLLIIPAKVIVIEQLPLIAPLLGKDANLTGRVDLWLLLPSYIAQRLWLGHGFAAFWVQDSVDSVNVIQIWDTVGWEPPCAHNGWLDTMLELGFVGGSAGTLVCRNSPDAFRDAPPCPRRHSAEGTGRGET
jgi:O-antigen ligase